MTKMVFGLLLVLTVSFAHAADDDVFDGPSRQDEPSQLFLALAIGTVPTGTDGNRGAQVGGLGAALDPEKAERKAIARCKMQGIAEKRTDAGANCDVVVRAEHGCLYYTLGNTPWGDFGYGRATTPQGAYNQCHGLNLDCDVHVAGICADPPFRREFSDVVKAAPVKTVFAFKSGRSRATDGKPWVYAGLGFGPTESWAIGNAKIQCDLFAVKHGVAACEGDSATFTRGCHWVTATLDKNNNPVTPIRDTRQDAIDACIALDGLECEAKAIGGCAVD